MEDKEIHNRKNVIHILGGEEDWLVSFSSCGSFITVGMLY